VHTKVPIDRGEVRCIDARYEETRPQFVADRTPDFRWLCTTQSVQIGGTLARELSSLVLPVTSGKWGTLCSSVSVQPCSCPLNRNALGVSRTRQNRRDGSLDRG